MFNKKNTPAKQPEKPISLRINQWRNDRLNHGSPNRFAVDVSESQWERMLAIAFESEQPND